MDHRAYYERLRAEAERENMLRRERVYALEPFREIEQARGRVINALGRAAIEGQGGAQALRDELAALAGRERELLREYGFGVDYLDMESLRSCAHCADTGLIREKDGTVRRCRCAKALSAAVRMEEAGLALSQSDTFANFNLEAFRDHGHRGLMEKLRGYSLRFCEQFPQTEKRVLVFTGETGVGKTFLLNCIAHRVAERGFGVMSVSMYRLVREAYKQDAVAEQCLSADLLAIDDLGAEPRYGAFSAETLFNILNERMISGRHTVLSSNLKTGELRERYSERVYSRLFSKGDSAAFELKGRDLRRD